MSGMDRLTDEQWAVQYLEDDAEACSAVNGSNDGSTKDARRLEVLVKRLIRERDEARRASQASPAPVGVGMYGEYTPITVGSETTVKTQAQPDGLREALFNLEKAASEVSRLGAQTGSQWSRLSIALLKARSALSESAEQNKENPK